MLAAAAPAATAGAGAGCLMQTPQTTNDDIFTV